MLKHEAERWLSIQRDLGRAPNTLLAYRRSLESYGSFCLTLRRPVYEASKEDVALFVRFMTAFRLPASRKTKSERSGMANATIRLRLTAVRLFYDHLIEEGLRENNPVGRGRHTQGGGFGGARPRALVPHFTALPWIPTDAEWWQLLHTARSESLRNRVMLTLTYDAGLRREELCLLATGDIDPAHRLLTIRAETTKSRRGRVVPYSEAAGSLLSAYQALATPRSVRCLIGPDPRIIQDDVWAKLMWAGLNLTDRELSKPDDPEARGDGHFYPATMVKALVLVWLFAGLRRNEIARLRVGCIRWQSGEEKVSEQPVCFLHVPVSKTGTAFSKPIDGVVGRAVEV